MITIARGVRLGEWLPIFQVGGDTRIRHYLTTTGEPDVVFFDKVPGWLGDYGEFRFQGASKNND